MSKSKNKQKWKINILFVLFLLILINLTSSLVYADYVVISGHLTYLDEDQNDAPVPIRNATVKLYDKDLIVDDHLGTTTTDANGDYEFEAVENIDEDGTGLDVYIRAYAENSVLKVIDENLNTYSFESISYPDIATHYTIDWETPAGKHGAYHILSMISMAADFIEDVSETVPPKVTVNWTAGVNGKTHYLNNIITLRDSDTFDKDVFFHEYAHHLQNTYAEIPPIDYGGDGHDWDSPETLQTAWAEGFADFFAVSISS